MTIAETRAECANLVAAFAHHVDHREFDRAVALFTADGAFLRPDLEARGHTEIARIWADRPASVVTRHLCGASFFTDMGSDNAAAVTNFTLYMIQWNGTGLPVIGQPAAVGEFHDRFVRTEQGWRIAERRGVPVLKGN